MKKIVLLASFAVFAIINFARAEFINPHKITIEEAYSIYNSKYYSMEKPKPTDDLIEWLDEIVTRMYFQGVRDAAIGFNPEHKECLKKMRTRDWVKLVYEDQTKDRNKERFLPAFTNKMIEKCNIN